MKCSFCGYDETKVIDSRLTEEGDAVRRRRECPSCNKRFTTYERSYEIPITIIKKNKETQPFDRQKLLNGLIRACVKREIPVQILEKIVENIENELRNQYKYEVTSKQLGEMALKRLKELDKVAYVRFASVYRQFKDVDQFMDEVKRLKNSD
ncbi:MAG: transcriptional regulator NrdR [Spirochaetales bacterium]|nr:transcriptional regulator NrdR [Spirochaetales bacterium]